MTFVITGNFENLKQFQIKMEELGVGAYREVLSSIQHAKKTKESSTIRFHPDTTIIFPPGENYKGVTNFRLLLNVTIGSLVLPLSFWNFL